MPNATPGSTAAFADAGDGPDTVWPGVFARARRRARTDPGVVAAVAFLTLLALAAILGPLLVRWEPMHQLDLVTMRQQPPSMAHWFGTDPAARDVFSRVISGARVSLGISLVAVAIASVIGTAWGAVAGYAGGVVDWALMRVVDALLSIPRIVLLLGIAALWEAFTVPALVVLLGTTAWFGVARLVRTQVLALRQRGFVDAARALGAGPLRIVVRHVLPHAAAPVLVQAALGVGTLILAEAGLSFLGRGVPMPQASWGNIIFAGREAFPSAWWLSLFPGLALTGTVLAVNVLADRLRQALDPRQLPRP